MNRVRILSGLHEGTEVHLLPGDTRLGADPDNHLILLDDAVPATVACLHQDEAGLVELRNLHPHAQLKDSRGREQAHTGDRVLNAPLSDPSGPLIPTFEPDVSGSRQPASALRREPRLQNTPSDETSPQAQVWWQIHIGSLIIQIDCLVVPAQTVQADIVSSDTQAHRIGRQDTQPSRIPLGWLSGWPHAMLQTVLGRLSRLQGRSRWLMHPGFRLSVAGVLTVILIGGFYLQVNSGLTANKRSGESSGQAVNKPLFESLNLSYSLSLNHQAAGRSLDSLLDDKTLQNVVTTETDGLGGGRDEAEPRSLKLSTELTTGLSLRAGDLAAEQALAFFQERSTQSPWVSRLTFNTHGSRVTARGVLSETERIEFERLLSLAVREYGQQVSFRVSIDPIEVPISLQVKQVVGGSHPVAILEDGTRLTPGSYHEGRLVESITVERIVLRGKDRVEVPI